MMSSFSDALHVVTDSVVAKSPFSNFLVRDDEILDLSVLCSRRPIKITVLVDAKQYYGEAREEAAA